MKGGARLAAGVAIGYALGRTRKMRLAMMLAGAGLSRQAGGPQELLQRGASVLGSSKELTKITDTIRGELMDAARAAAVTAASNRIDALNARLQGRGESAEAEEDTGEEERPEDADDYAEEDYESDEDREDEEEDEEDTEPEKGKRSSSTRARTPTRRRAAASSSRSKASSSGERKPTGARQRRARADTADSAPVRRTRR
ncbi:hypothetical protein [Nocardia bhagyanarayanae]|uniref:Uncharacterized protein n=1 Tax=Nocardia bhagyanarayanae TaxID=1215925 RepID=A0A543FG75_9NOCA|nr:hypothetical protein [Nocardia bhagyanarayanae]TQM32860.1 hypothetical protein FB390_4560 [Nocardia bhagyanarayanae]